MIKGIDISHWQKNVPKLTECDFVICKASEGATHTDVLFNKHLDECKKRNIAVVGAYHYAKTYNDPVADAYNFYTAIKDRSELGVNMVLALDIEGEDIRREGWLQWCEKWLDTVYKYTSIRPLIYISASYCKYLQPILNKNYGLWVAHWGAIKPTTGVYPIWAIWQYTNKLNGANLDGNYFNGGIDQLLKYCKKG